MADLRERIIRNTKLLFWALNKDSGLRPLQCYCCYISHLFVCYSHFTDIWMLWDGRTLINLTLEAFYSIYKYQSSPSPDSSPPQIAYLWQLRLKIPYNGPMICMNTSRLIEKRRTSVSVLMLACLGTFLKRAISPKQSPFLYAYTILFWPSLALQATNCPSATMQKQFPISPSLMMYLSAGNLRSSRLSNSLVRQQISRSLKNSILSTKASHSLSFWIILVLSMRLNSCRSSQKSFPGVSAVMVDALGWLQRRASSPKNSPALYSFKIYQLPFFSHLNLPYSTMYRISPLSPSCRTTSPSSTALRRTFAMSLRRLSWLRCSKKMHFLRQRSRLILVSSGQFMSFLLSVELRRMLKDCVLSPETPFLTLFLPLSRFLRLS